MTVPPRAVLPLVLLAASAAAQRELVKPEVAEDRKLENLDFEAPAGPDGLPPGWLGGGVGFERSVDLTLPHQGRQCGRIRWLGDEGAAAGVAPFAVLTQGVAAAGFRGQRLELSGWLRSAEITGNAGLWMRVDGPEGTLVWDNMRDRAVTGTSSWQRFTVVLEVDARAVRIYLGALLQGRGTLWVDDVALRAVGADVAVTGSAVGPGAVPGLFELRGEYSIAAVAGVEATRGPHLWMPVPLCDREQVPVCYALTATPADAVQQLRVFEDRPGNFVAEARLAPPKPGASIALRWNAIVLCGPRSFADVPKSAPLPAAWPNEVAQWLRSTRFVQASDARIQEVAQRARGKSQDALQILAATLREARRIKDAQQGNAPDLGAVAALTAQGSCTSNANLLAALLRGAGLPARILAGYPSWSGPLLTHYTVEAFLPDYGWYPIEPTMLIAPWPPCGQIQVAVVPPEHEDRGIERFPNAAGVPWLSLTEHIEHDGSYVAAGAVDFNRHCDHVAVQWRRFPADAPAAEWNQALAAARGRWHDWLAGKPACGAGGRVATPLGPDDLAAATTPALLAGRLGGSATRAASR